MSLSRTTWDTKLWVPLIESSKRERERERKKERKKEREHALTRKTWVDISNRIISPKTFPQN